jgi:hypothetical protein
VNRAGQGVHVPTSAVVRVSAQVPFVQVYSTMPHMSGSLTTPPEGVIGSVKPMLAHPLSSVQYS